MIDAIALAIVGVLALAIVFANVRAMERQHRRNTKESIEA